MTAEERKADMDRRIDALRERYTQPEEDLRAKLTEANETIERLRFELAEATAKQPRACGDSMPHGRTPGTKVYLLSDHSREGIVLSIDWFSDKARVRWHGGGESEVSAYELGFVASVNGVRYPPEAAK